jgi:hypothetical protein
MRCARRSARCELPEPRYTDAQWRQLEALRTVLLHLAAELKVHFAERRNIDFVELGLAARRALGRVEAPPSSYSRSTGGFNTCSSTSSRTLRSRRSACSSF